MKEMTWYLPRGAFGKPTSSSSITRITTTYRRAPFLFMLFLVLLLCAATADYCGAAVEAAAIDHTSPPESRMDHSYNRTTTAAREADPPTPVTPVVVADHHGDGREEEQRDEEKNDDEPLTSSEPAAVPLVEEEIEAEAAADKALILAAVAAAPQRLPTYVETALEATPLRRRDLGRYYYRTMLALLAHGNLSEVVLRAQEGAAVGHGRLHWLLGVLHMHGLGVERSTAKGLLHYSMAAIDGVAEAHAALGERYLWGDGVRRNCEAAVAHLREAADAVAMTYDSRFQPRQPNTVGFVVNGIDGGQERRNIRPIDELLLALERASPESAPRLLTIIGDCYAKGRCKVAADWHAARDYYAQAVAAGDATVNSRLGLLYYHGDAAAVPPVAADLERAHHHFLLGARAGDGAGLTGMGFLHAVGYLMGDEVAPAFQTPPQPHASLRPDFATARRYFAEAAAQSSGEGMYNLAILHLHGRGVPVDPARAEALLEQAALRGSLLAQWQLAGLLLRQGACGRAVQLYRHVASFGSWADTYARKPLTFLDDGGRHRRQKQQQQAASTWTGSRALQREDENAGDGAAPEGEAAAAAAAHEDAQRLHELLRYAADAPTPLVQLVEALQIAETGGEEMVARAVELLDVLRVPTEAAGQVHGADDRYAAHPTDLPEGLTAALSGEVMYLLWLHETSAAIRADYLRSHADTAAATRDVDTHVRQTTAATEDAADGAPLPLPLPPRWLVAQHEARELLRHDLLRRLARRAWRSGEQGTPQLRRVEASDALGTFFYEGRSRLLGIQLPLAMHYYDRRAQLLYGETTLWYGWLHQSGIHRRAAELQQRLSVAGRPDGSTALRRAAESWMLRTGFQHDRVAMHALLDIAFSTTPMNLTDYRNAHTVYENSFAMRRGRAAVRLARMGLTLQWWYTYFTQRVVFGLSREKGVPMPFFNATAYVAAEDRMALQRHAKEAAGAGSSGSKRRTQSEWQALWQERRAAARRAYDAQQQQGREKMNEASPPPPPSPPPSPQQQPEEEEGKGEEPFFMHELWKEVKDNFKFVYDKGTSLVSQLDSYRRVESIVLYFSLVALFALILVRDHL